ncbi:hypothetical protein ACFYXQ_12395 [Nocardia jiangxiensis]|uniref:Uncharacterized protein n=1 Tax=Nocardia jiangxiensis TaxID=282685 RepID=A0ABW6S046_9NOCA
MTGRGRGVRWDRIWPAGYSLVLALVVVGPLLGPGYLLLRDGVSTPRSYPTDSALGLGDAAPRAVPQDWLLATVSSVVDGGIVVKAILVAALWAAGWGAAALARRLLDVPVGPQLVAATIAVWNPYVAERLLQGHWSLLAGYAALPWTVLAAYGIRRHAQEKLTVAAQPDQNLRRDAADVHGEANNHDQVNDHDQAGRHIRAGARSRRNARIGAGTRGRVNVRGQGFRAWAVLGSCLAAAGLTPTGALLAGCVAFVVIGRRNLVGALGLWCVASAPWLVAVALSGTGAEPSDPAGITAFAARAEPGLGTIGSLAGLGGIWNAQAVPGSRTTLFALVGTVVLLLVVAGGIRRVAAPGDAATRYIRRALLILAAVVIALPALGATGWGLHVGQFLVTRIPGAGLFRDTQKYVALAMPAFALCAAAGCRAIAARVGSALREPNVPEHPSPVNPSDGTLERSTDITEHHSPAAHPDAASGGDTAPQGEAARDSEAAREDAAAEPARADDSSGTGLVAAVFIVLLIVVLPDLAWGVGGAMRAVRYPAGWQQVAERMDGPGDVAVLPGGMFREFPYSGRVPVLDPAPRMLPRDVLQTGELPVRGGTVTGEGSRARIVEKLLLSGATPDELAAHGVGWVLVEHTSPGPLGDSRATLDRSTAVYTDHDLSLYRVPNPRDMSAKSHGLHRSIATIAHLAWALLLLTGVAAAACGRWPIRRTGRAERPDR